MTTPPERPGKFAERRARYESELIQELLSAEQTWYAASSRLAKFRASHGGALTNPDHGKAALGPIRREYLALRRYARAWKALSQFRASGKRPRDTGT